MNNQLQSLLILGSVAVVGGLVGGIVNNAGSSSNVAKEQQHEAKLRAAEVRGAARVYREQLELAADSLEDDRKTGHWPAAQELRLFELPPSDDRDLVQSELPTAKTEEVTTADTAMQDIDAYASEHPDEGLSEEDTQYVSEYIEDLHDGASALTKLAD